MTAVILTLCSPLSVSGATVTLMTHLGEGVTETVWREMSDALWVQLPLMVLGWQVQPLSHLAKGRVGQAQSKDKS